MTTANSINSFAATQALQDVSTNATRNTELNRASQQFESMFLTQMLSHMTSEIEVDDMFGGGSGEQMFRGMLNEQYAGSMAKTGMTGISSAIKAELIKLQEGGK